jgi:predicted nucleic acid-binding protein
LITAVDTNVLLDILGADARFGDSSAEALRHCMSEGALIACDVVWAETATAFTSIDRFSRAMMDISVSFEPMSEEASAKAAQVWKLYRARGGSRARIASDFLIGGHAFVAADRLLTRDRGFYRRYFSGLMVLEPAA